MKRYLIFAALLFVPFFWAQCYGYGCLDSVAAEHATGGHTDPHTIFHK